MIRILHVLGGLDLGGAETFVMNCYRAMNRSKVQFDFVIHNTQKQFFRSEIAELGGRIFICPQYDGKNHLSYCRWWELFFKEHPKYKIIHAHVRSTASIFLRIAKSQGLTTIAHSHSTSNGKGFSALVKNALQFPIRHYADYMFACSQEAGEWLFGKKAVNSPQFKVIPNAIDSEKFAFDPEKRKIIRKELNIENVFVVGHVGRFSEPKNHVFLLDCFAELLKSKAEAVLLLVGDGELLPTIRQKAQELGIEDKVIFTGATQNTYDYYQAMDVFVFPSLWEGLGIAAIEAQASGLHCVASDTVPAEIDIGGGLVQRLSLGASFAQWTDAILKTKGAPREDMTDSIKAASYDIKENAAFLQDFYLTHSK